MSITQLSEAAALAAYDFDAKLAERGVSFERASIRTAQVNVGKFCNQACHHCHVEASPIRTEKMTRSTAERVVELLRATKGVEVVDVTGGAPELNANFRYLVESARALGLRVIDRCNLTVLETPGQEDLAEFLAANRVEVVASLPCYTKENVEKQRGNNVFDASIRALRRFNELGYGQPDSGLELNLVYNPLGAFLPPDQAKLEADYKKRLKEDWGVVFNRLFALANMPIKRFADMLAREGKFEEYMDLLVRSFNPAAAAEAMCRTMVSVDWDGRLSDCDFNQMLDLPLAGPKRTIHDVDSFDVLRGGRIATGPHCFGCAAGSGSSCGGSLL